MKTLTHFWCLLVLISIVFVALSNITVANGRRTFKVDVLKVETSFKSREYVHLQQAQRVKFNDTHHAINATATINKDLPLDAVIDVIAYERLPGSKKYNLFPISLGTVRVCEYIKSAALYKDVVDSSDLPVECPITTNTYHVTNYIVNPEVLPPVLPGTYWKLDLILKSKKQAIWKLSLHVYINRKK